MSAYVPHSLGWRSPQPRLWIVAIERDHAAVIDTEHLGVDEPVTLPAMPVCPAADEARD